MNKKLIAAAVSAAVVAPVTAFGEASFYGRINNAIDINDLGAESDTDVSGVSSRFGFKYSGDIGNGLTAHGRYEFFTTTDKEQPGVNDTRIATAGLSGAFGRVDIGNQWSAYFNTFGTLVSPTYTLGYYLYSSVGGGPYRASNTIKYSNSFGPLSVQLDVRLNDSDETNDEAEKLRGDGIGLGLSFAVNDNITIAAAFDSDDRPSGDYDGVIGITAQVAAVPAAAVAAVPAVPATHLVPAVPAVPAKDEVEATDNAGDGVLANISDGYLTDGEFDAEDRGQDEERIGIGIKATFGNFWASLGWQNYQTDDLTYTAAPGSTIDRDDDVGTDGATAANEVGGASYKLSGADVDTIFLYGGGSLGEKTSWLIGYSEANDGADGNDLTINNDDATIERLDTDDSTQLTWGVYHNIGGGLRVYYEATDVDSENNGHDGTVHLLGMRVDF